MHHEEEAPVEPPEEGETRMIKANSPRQRRRACLLHHQGPVLDGREEKPCGQCTQTHLRSVQLPGSYRTRSARNSLVHHEIERIRGTTDGVS